MGLRTVGVKLTADTTEFVTKLKGAGETAKSFAGQLSESAKAGKLDAVADQATKVGLGLAGMAAYAIKSAADFDKSMSSVSAATHASKGDLDQLRAAALQAGKDTMYSATQAADGITELSKAGISTANILNGGLNGALSLAAAGQLDVGEAAEIAASAMTQFKLSGSQVPHVADLLAAAAGKAQGSVHDMGYALSQGGLVAAQFGLSVEDTTGVLAEFASAGLLGSDAGTSLKTMLLSLANPSIQTRNLMASLGISFYDAQGKFVGLTGVAQVLQTRLKDLTQEQRNAALAQIFGTDAIRGASILYTDGAAGVKKWKDAVNDSGYAASTAAKQTDNLAGDLERLKGSLETVAIQAGSGGNTGLRLLTKSLNDVVDQFVHLPPAIGGAVTVLAGLSGVVLLGLAAWVKLRKGIVDAAEQLASMGPAGEKAASTLSAVSSAAAKASLVFGALEVVQVVADNFHSASVNVDKLTDSLANFATTGKVAGALGDVFGSDLSGLAKNAQTADAATHGFWGKLNDLTSSIPGVHAMVDGLNESIYGLSFNEAKDNMTAFDQALTAYMTNVNDAKKASDLWNQVLSESGLDTQQLAALLPNAYKEVGALNTAADKSATSVGGLGTAASGTASATGDLNSALAQGADDQKAYATVSQLATSAAQGERNAIQDLGKALKGQVDPVFAVLDAEDSLTAAQKAATKATSDHGAASGEAKKANRALAEAAIDLETKIGVLGDSFNGKLDPALVNTLKAAGLTKAQIADVAKQFRQAKGDGDQFAKNYGATVGVSGVPKAKAQIQDLKGELASMKVNWDVNIRQHFLTFGKPYSTANPKYGGLASGGPVTGRGPKGVDSELRLLAPGEHVWTAAEVDAAGGQRAVASLRASALSRSNHAMTPARMAPLAAAGSHVIVETKHTIDFANADSAMATALIKLFRNNAGARTTMVRTLQLQGSR